VTVYLGEKAPKRGQLSTLDKAMGRFNRLENKALKKKQGSESKKYESLTSIVES
jgi:hypothetical protein